MLKYTHLHNNRHTNNMDIQSFSGPKNARVRKTERGLRLSGHLTIQASRELERIREEYGNRAYDILSTAMIWYGKFMRGELGASARPAYLSGPTKRAESATTVALSAAKAIWCEEFGGKVEGNLCMFDKYEITLAGQTEVSMRTVALKDMPDSKEEFKSMVLGPYSDIYAARRAVKDSN